jgi:hypothetical protein
MSASDSSKRDIVDEALEAKEGGGEAVVHDDRITVVHGSGKTLA